MNYPKTLSYFVNRIGGHSTNNFKINPQGSSSASPSGIVRFDLPNNTLIDLKELRFMFNASVSGATTSNVARLPDKISSLIERVNVTSGGSQIYSGHSAYNRVKHIKDALEKGKSKQLSDPLAHDFIVAPSGNSPVDGVATSANEAYGSLVTPFCVGGGDLLGWFEGMPRIIDTSLLAQVSVELTWAPSSVVVSSADSSINTAPSSTTGVTYSVTNLRMLVQSYGLNDGGAYDRMIESEIAQQGFIEFNFKEYYTQFDEAFTGNARWSLAGVQSLDKIYVGFNSSTYQTIGAAVAVEGRGITESKNKSKYFNMVQPSGLTGLQIQINGGFYPSYSANVDEMLALTLGACDYKEGEIACREQYVKNYFVFAQRFNHPETGLNVVSGMDFSNINMSGSVVATGSFTAVPIIIVAECTSTLRIGAQLQIQKIA